jgi:ligand-binding sensor domain-containing protein
MRSNDAGMSWALDGAGVPSSCCTAIVYERNSSTNIWLATFDDIYRSTNGGVTWTPSKIGNEHVTALDLNAEGALVAGTENNGLFRRASSSAPWLPANSGFLASNVLAVAADQSHAGTLYAGTQRTGLFKSTDHAHSWQRLSADLLDLHFVALTIDPANSSTVYAGAANGSGFYKSTDAGATWSSPSFVPGAYAIVIDPSASNTLYVGTGRGVSKTTDGGASFTSVSKGLPSFTAFVALAIDPANPLTLYAGGTGTSGLYKTTDGGANWTKKLGQVSVGAIVVDRTNPATVFMTTTNGIMKSTDRGETWTESNSGIPTKSTAALWIDPLDGHRLYASTVLNGVFRSTDAGATWTSLGGVAPTELIGSLAVEPGGNVVHAAGSGGVFSYAFPGSGTIVRRRGTVH